MAAVQQLFDQAEFLALADARLADLIDGAGGGSTLDATLLRLFDPDEPAAVAAFNSSL